MHGLEVPLTTTNEVVTHKVGAMGTTAELMVVGGAGDRLIEWAVGRLEQLEATWSRFRPDSELCRLDRHAGHGPVPVSSEMVIAVGHALSLWYVTDGRFDPTVRRSLEASGYDRTFRLVAPDGPALAEPPAPAPGCDGVRLDRVHSTVSLPTGVALDLGGVGKGLAADLVATGLTARGAAGACVGLGGDVRVAGTAADGSAWRIEVEDPFDETRILFSRSLDNKAIVTSTTRFRRWTRGGSVLHHIIDPATGAPADRGVTAVIAEGDDAWWSEGVAKAALVAGVDDGLDLLERLGVAAVVIDDCGDHHATRSWSRAMTATVDTRFWWWLSRSSGVVAWLVVAAAVVWGLLASTRMIRRRGMPAWILDLHRYLGTLTIVFVAIHVGAIWADSFVSFGPRQLFVPFASTWRPRAVAWGIVSTYLLIAIQTTSWAMRKLPRRVWHRIHVLSIPDDRDGDGARLPRRNRPRQPRGAMERVRRSARHRVPARGAADLTIAIGPEHGRDRHQVAPSRSKTRRGCGLETRARRAHGRRQQHPEPGAARIHQVEPAAERFDERSGKRETHTRPTPQRDVALEDALGSIGRDAGALVRDRHLDVPRPTFDADLNGSGAVTQRVVDERVDGLGQGRRRNRGVTTHVGRERDRTMHAASCRPPRVGAVGDEPADVDRPQVGASVGPRQREHLIDRARESIGLLERRERLAAHIIVGRGRQLLETQPQRGQWCAKLVRRVRGQLAFRADQVVDPGRRLIERGRDGIELGNAAARCAYREVAGAEASRREGQLVHRTTQPPSQDHRESDRDRDAGGGQASHDEHRETGAPIGGARRHGHRDDTVPLNRRRPGEAPPENAGSSRHDAPVALAHLDLTIGAREAVEQCLVERTVVLEGIVDREPDGCCLAVEPAQRVVVHNLAREEGERQPQDEDAGYGDRHGRHDDAPPHGVSPSRSGSRHRARS